MKKFCFIIVLMFTFFSIANAIEVGGHLTEDTTWSPENNPYLVTSGVYVDSDVTLTILPGTIVKFYSDYYDDLGDDQFYFHSGEEPIAKFMRVEGRIIAEGTEQDSIIFTRMQDEQYYHWGTIYLPEGADRSIFKHCLFEFSAFTGFSLSEQPRAAIAMWNGSAMIDKCDFIDNDTAIYIRNNVTEIQITNNYFDNIDYGHPNIMNHFGYFISTFYIYNIDTGSPLIAGNTFVNGTAIRSSKSMYFVSNNIDSVLYNRKVIYLSSTDGISYFYNNSFGSASTGINSYSNGLDYLYIRSNYFATEGGDGVNIDDAYVEISNNCFEGCELDTGYDAFGKIFNNKIDEGKVFIGVNISYYNNILTNYNGTSCALSGYNVHNLGNIIVNNETAFNNSSDTLHTNSIILQNEELFWAPTQDGTDTFRNCIIDFELEYPLIDGGGNIWVDSLQAQSIFEDIENGDFHLLEGSLAVDAGFDTLGYYYPFDMDDNHRIWDGDNNGTAIIDIGPYEFGAPSLGGIEGYTYNPTTGNPVDYVLLKINNQPGKFTFTDGIGNFEYRLPAGIYNVYAERVFYEDVIEYQVEVIDGEFTQLNIQMYESVDIDNNEIIPMKDNLNLTNFPNPFNPSTTISFSVTQNSDFVNLEVYNIKGQKVKTLLNEEMQNGKHTTVWYGLDSNNKPVSSGIYLYKIKVGNQESVKRMLLLK
ncbi:MAG: FlgD immunoglobulin-like domain containing protein [Candidatus Tenebribacter mawsonii]|nr:FlgD immunoglobulin-like domain containing protein [Candidatus Tenebribacter mawsonii]